MKGMTGFLTALGLWLVFGTANAQMRVKVGQCYDQVHEQQLDIVKTRAFNPALGSVTPLYSQLIRPPKPGYSEDVYAMVFVRRWNRVWHAREGRDGMRSKCEGQDRTRNVHPFW